MDMTYLTDGSRHLICKPYSIANLHIMAENLNIKRCWYHSGKFPHYDIPKRRIEEIESQCEIITSKELIEIIANMAEKGGNRPISGTR